MKRNFALVVALLLVIGFALSSIAQAAPPKDPIGCVAIKKGQPIHIAYWMVVAGGDSSLGIDTRRGVEIAIQDKGGKLLGYPIKLSGQDTGCNAEGGQAAATKLASDPTHRCRHRLQLLQRSPAGRADPLEGRHLHRVALQHRAVPDRPEARQGV